MLSQNRVILKTQITLFSDSLKQCFLIIYTFANVIIKSSLLKRNRNAKKVNYNYLKCAVCFSQVQNLRVWIFECRDPSYQAFKLGFAAAILLAFAHAVANLLGGCHFVSSKPELDRATSNKQLAMASLILSW